MSAVADAAILGTLAWVGVAEAWGTDPTNAMREPTTSTGRIRRVRSVRTPFSPGPFGPGASGYRSPQEVVPCVEEGVPSKLSGCETTVERSLYKALRELQRLQAARRADGNAPPPVAIDVDVSGVSRDER